MTYKTIKEASKKTGISVSSIKMVLDKYLDSIYGLKFCRLKEKRFLKGKKKYIKIQCSNGMVFDGCKEAAEFIKKQHKLKNNLRYIMSNIYACIIGTQGTILGLQFWQQGEKQPKMPEPYRKKMKPIGCSNGKKYESLTEASKDLGIDFRLISQVLRNKQKTTKGLSFWYLKYLKLLNKIS